MINNWIDIGVDIPKTGFKISIAIIEGEILKLKKLLDNGTIDEEEFKKAKDKILNN